MRITSPSHVSGWRILLGRHVWHRLSVAASGFDSALGHAGPFTASIDNSLNMRASQLCFSESEGDSCFRDRLVPSSVMRVPSF